MPAGQQQGMVSVDISNVRNDIAKDLSSGIVENEHQTRPAPHDSPSTSQRGGPSLRNGRQRALAEDAKRPGYVSGEENKSGTGPDSTAPDRPEVLIFFETTARYSGECRAACKYLKTAPQAVKKLKAAKQITF